jgi:chromate transporter
MKNNKFLRLFFIFFKISSLTIGGGYAMIPVIEDEIVNTYKLLEREQFLNLIAKAQASPGVIAFNCSLFIGYEIGGFLGALISSLGIFIPPFFIILLISIFYNNFTKNIYINNFLYGIKICLAALLINLGLKLFKERFNDLLSIIIFIIFLISYYIFKLNPIFILLGSFFIYYSIYLIKIKSRNLFVK